MNKSQKKSLLLIDGHSHLYRSFYALPILTNFKGILCNAIYGVINQINYLYDKYQPKQMIVVFDNSINNFRNLLFAKYKKNRSKIPDDLKSQISPLIKILKYSGIPVIMHPKVEADDVIGSLTFQAIKNKYNIIRISTNDKDICQLVNSNVKIVHSSSKDILGPKDVEKKYGVPPKFITSFLALTGDNTDNIPGVPSIGKKTATLLIKTFGSLKNIYNNLKKIELSKIRGSKKIVNNLEKNKKTAFLSLKLVTIKSNINFDLNQKNLKTTQPNIRKLSLLFNFYQFYKWEKKLQLKQWFLHKKEKNKKSCLLITKKNTHAYKIINDENTFLTWILKVKNSKKFSFIIEIDTFFFKNHNILSITLAINPNEIIYLPFKSVNNVNKNLLNLYKILKYLKPFFEDPLKMKIMKNFKLNIQILKIFNIKLLGNIYDTILTSYILHNKIYIQKYNTQTLHLISKKKLIHCTINNVIKKMYKMFVLHLHLYESLKKEQSIKKILKKTDIPLTKVISKIESNGVLINSKILKKYSKKIQYKLEQLKIQAYEITGEKFNISSIKQSQNILFTKIGLKSTVKTKTGNLSTNEKVLSSLSNVHPLPIIILKYRSLHKLQSTYINTLLKIQNLQTKRVYTCYQQTSTLTGRLSSINPNLQNIPIRTKEGRYIRKAFIAPKGYLLLCVDYSQIELRIMAHLSKDKKLIQAFSENKDIHCLTATDIFQINYSQVTKNQRQIAKTINFSLIYGMSAFGLSKKLNISIKKSKKYINNYFLQYKNVQKYILNVYQTAKKNGFIKTLEGRKIYIPNLNSKNNTLRKSAERSSINAPMQGSAADIIKKSMINIDKYLTKNNLNHTVKMIMQVHDELIFEVQSQKIKLIYKEIKQIMENSIKLKVPLKVNFGIGKNWDEASL